VVKKGETFPCWTREKGVSINFRGKIMQVFFLRKGEEGGRSSSVYKEGE